MVTSLLFNLSIPFIWQFGQNTDILNLGHMFIYGDFHNTLNGCKTPTIYGDPNWAAQWEAEQKSHAEGQV